MSDSGRRTPLATVTLAQVRIDPVDMRGALDRIDGFIRDRSPHYNIGINAAKVVGFQTDSTLQEAVRGAHLVTADGQAVVWGIRALGQRIPGRVAGVDLTEELLAHAASRDYSVYLLGAKDEIVRTCVAKASRLYPSLRIAGYRNGYFSREEEAGIVSAIRTSRPDILFIGFGSPAKEYFMKRYCRELEVPFVMGVGGTFDVFAGVVRRAPRWMQHAGLEWAFRLWQEPRRMWRRYLVGNTRFMLLVAEEIAGKWLRPAGRT